MKPRLCLDCGSVLRGRSDKKYCNDFCRNSYHNRERLHSYNHIRDINKKLLQNHRVLKSMFPEGEEMVRISREALLQEGFRFNMLTHENKNAGGVMYRFCYDIGYLPLDENWVLLVKRKPHIAT